MHTNVHCSTIYNRSVPFNFLVLSDWHFNDCNPSGFPVLHHVSTVAQTHVHWVDDAIKPSHPLSSLSPPALNLSQHQCLFKWVSSSHQVNTFTSRYWSFRFSISPSNEHPGLISFRMDWLDLLAVQGTLKSLLQHRSSKASILLCFLYLSGESNIH